KPEVIAKLELNWWRLGNIPEGTKFGEYAIQHVKEQFGISKALSIKAAKCMMQALVEGEKSKWGKAKSSLGKFYTLIKEEVKLAFEPKLAATLQVKLWKDMNSTNDVRSSGEIEDVARNYFSEVYRISNYQAAKVAHLRVLA